MIDIDRARIEDLSGIKSLLAVTWRDTYSSFLPESVIAKVAADWHSPEVLEAELSRHLTFAGVARSSSAGIVGMITAHSHGELLIVARLYVLPAFQRQGIGERLMRESCRAFPQSRRIRLHVEEQNPKGRAFYRKLGFREVEVKTDEIAGTKLKSIVMEKPHSDVSVRQAIATDAGAVTSCVVAAFQPYIERIGKPPSPMLADYASLIAAGHVWIVEYSSRIEGVLVGYETANGFCLETVAVHPSRQGVGVGRALLQFAEREATRRGFSSIYLNTNSKMTENQSLYTKIGYIEYERKFEAGYDRVFFRKQLRKI